MEIFSVTKKQSPEEVEEIVRKSTWRPMIWVGTFLSILLLLGGIGKTLRRFELFAEPKTDEEIKAERIESERFASERDEYDRERKARKECWDKLPKGLASRDFSEANRMAEKCVRNEMAKEQ